MTASNPDHDPSSKKSSKPWMRMASLGIELASITLGIAGLGYVIDWQRGHATPYATAVGALVGFSFAMFRFIQKATGGV